MISISHTSYFPVNEPYKGELSIRMMTDIATGWASRNLSEGDLHFLSFPEQRPDGHIYISGLLIHRHPTHCDFEWIGSAGTAILISGDTE